MLILWLVLSSLSKPWVVLQCIIVVVFSTYILQQGRLFLKTVK